MDGFAYAIHTHNCTYFLDEQGVCLWVISVQGALPPGTERCVGAQYVACLDPLLPGGLTGELTVGATALFAGKSSETGRLALFRTGLISQIEHAEANVDGEGAPTRRLEAISIDLTTDEIEILAEVPVRIVRSRGGSIPVIRPYEQRDSQDAISTERRGSRHSRPRGLFKSDTDEATPTVPRVVMPSRPPVGAKKRKRGGSGRGRA